MIGERLTELRVKHNMTQEDFAEYMCVTRHGPVIIGLN
ncbi:MAG: helix-turn-helix transcriptional regulator [Lachnospiraceae bacterium]|nr:helix-turn-helix transcriptional regulator [Lachnospiraceae bacterium]